jgi:hypothetical protein
MPSETLVDFIISGKLLNALFLDSPKALYTTFFAFNLLLLLGETYSDLAYFCLIIFQRDF